MNNGFQTVPLGDILIRDEEWIDLQPEEHYKQVTVRLWGKGVVQRDYVSGSEIAAARRIIVKSRQFILSKIDARNGAFGLVPDFLDGAVVSSDFPVYALNSSQVLPEFLDWMSKTRGFIDLCKNASEGTTNRIRLKEEKFLAAEIPLPPLEEQQRIVARIEELAGRIEEARGLRREAVEEARVLFESSVGSIFENLEVTEQKPLRSLSSKIGSGSTPTGGRSSYPSSGIPFIRSQNVRMRYFQQDDIAFIDQATHETMRGTQVKPNDVLLNITGASIGRVACFPDDLNEANVNQHVAIIRPVKLLNSRYLMYWLSQPSVQKFIAEEQKGATRQGFTKAQIEAFEIPLPSLSEQQRIVTYLDDLQAKADTLKQLQSKTSAELDALLPSILDKAFKGELR